MAKKNKKIWHKISNVFDAYWFLKEHPKLQRFDRTPVTPRRAAKMEKEGYLIQRDPNGKCYRVWRHLAIPALDENLDIFYTKTNKPGGHGRVDDDKSKNKHIECWLEIGPCYYGFMYSGDPDKPQADYDDARILMHSHAYKCDTGGSTFDQALVNLARNVRREFGDYAPRDGRDGKCGKPICGDCSWKTKGKLGKQLGFKTIKKKTDAVK